MIVALMNYNRVNKFCVFDTESSIIDYSKAKDIEGNFLDIEDRGYYINSLLFGLTAFYRKNNELYLYNKQQEINLEGCSVKIISHPILSFVKSLLILKKGRLIKKVNFIKQKNLFQEDFTMARGDIDLNLCYLIYYILSDDNRKSKFLETGYYD